ncbi:uncharacterized protein LOC136081564 [Hydra vulgaris]|uniref:Uncharacterized protein LOC136081564 n=1 Tax=Hydra vulgaris TaxID=6087 RepID=A0ABM4C098_HYDVU
MESVGKKDKTNKARHSKSENQSIHDATEENVPNLHKVGNSIAVEILGKLKTDGLNIADCRGQGYDNGVNMAGKYKGVQAQIININGLTSFVPCACMTLNLVGVHAAEVSPLMIGKPGERISLKGHCETRWSSKKEAVASLNNQLVEVYNVLQDMNSRTTLNHETVAGAKDQLKLFNLKFLCLLNLWTKILTLIDRENHAMQAKKISIDITSKKNEWACLGHPVSQRKRSERHQRIC